MRVNFIPTHACSKTPQVTFFDAGVKGSIILNQATREEILTQKMNFHL